MNSKVFLIGFMGSGKSTIGKLLAQRLGYSFIDTDSEIELRLGKEILSVFNTDGENTFRIAENELIHDIIKKPDRLVIASGGGMPCSEENLNLMNFFGETIYLKRSIDDLYNILQHDNKNRPMLIAGPNLKSNIEEMRSKRESYYNMAKHVVEISHKESNTDIVEKIAILLHGK